MKTQSFYWNPRPLPKEDASLVDEKEGIVLVADGVSRTVEVSAYPRPSPALVAAQRLLEKTAEELRQRAETPRDMALACYLGNRAVREVNQELGFWASPDYWTKDLAGAVFAGLVLSPPHFLWGYLADCGLARIRSDGQLLWSTPDDLAPVARAFPPKTLAPRERITRIRREYRNRPGSRHPTYGVFTGEEAALKYLRTGVEELGPDEFLAVFTDGGRPLIDDPEIRLLLAQRAPTARVLEEVKRRHPNAGEITLVVVRQE